MTIDKKLIEKLRKIRERRDPKEAAKTTSELPEIPPMKDGETVAVVIPKR